MADTRQANRSPLAFSSSPPRPSRLSSSKRNDTPQTPPSSRPELRSGSSPIQSPSSNSKGRRSRLDDHSNLVDSPTRRPSLDLSLQSAKNPLASLQQSVQAISGLSSGSSPKASLSAPRITCSPRKSFSTTRTGTCFSPTRKPLAAKVRTPRLDAKVRVSSFPFLKEEQSPAKLPNHQNAHGHDATMGPPLVLPHRKSSMRFNGSMNAALETPTATVNKSASQEASNKRTSVSAGVTFSKFIQAFTGNGKTSENQRSEKSVSTEDTSTTLEQREPPAKALYATADVKYAAKRKSRQSSTACEKASSAKGSKVKAINDKEAPAAQLSASTHFSLLPPLELGPAFEEMQKPKAIRPPVKKDSPLFKSKSSFPEGSKKRRGRRSGAVCAPPAKNTDTPANQADIDRQHAADEKESEPESPSSTASSVPSIIVTPPPFSALASPFHLKLASRAIFSLSSDDSVRPQEGLGKDYPPDTELISIRAVPASSGCSAESTMGLGIVMDSNPAGLLRPWTMENAVNTEGKLGRDIMDRALADVFERRSKEDETAFAELAAEIDWVLSDFLNFKDPDESWQLSHNLIDLLQAAMAPGGVTRAYSITFRSRLNASSASAPASLKGDSLVLPTFLDDIDQGAVLMTRIKELEAALKQTCIEKLFKHIVSGISCLLSDSRLPYEGPQSLARLCCVLNGSMTSVFGPKAEVGQTNEEMTLGFGIVLPETPTAPFNCQEANAELEKPLDASSIFMKILNKEIENALERGYSVRDKACRLDVPSPRRNVRRRTPLPESPKTIKEKQREKNLQLLAKGKLTEEEWRSNERKAAAYGDAQDEFVSIDGVRFVGELYKLGMIPASFLQAWLNRLLYDTVHPDVASIWELECACALLITAGAALETEAANGSNLSPQTPLNGPESDLIMAFRCMSSSSAAGFSDDILATSSEKRKRGDDAPDYHWIHCTPSPSPGSRRSSWSMHRSRSQPLASGVPAEAPRLSYASRFGTPEYIPTSPTHSTSLDSSWEAKIVLEGAMCRLQSLVDHPDVDQGTKQWLQEVVSLRARKWKTPSGECVGTRLLDDDLFKPIKLDL